MQIHRKLFLLRYEARRRIRETKERILALRDATEFGLTPDDGPSASLRPD
jgi:hypothetical protein